MTSTPAEQLSIPDFDESLEEVPRLSLEEYVDRAKAEAAVAINAMYDRAELAIDNTYEIADSKLRRASRKIGQRSLRLSNPAEYRRQRQRRAYRPRWFGITE